MSEPGHESDEVLGRLPRTRLGRRSPLRGDAPQAPEPRPKRAAEPTPDPPTAAEASGSLAGMARAGAGIAVGAAGLGLRAAGGVLRALRGSSERP